MDYELLQRIQFSQMLLTTLFSKIFQEEQSIIVERIFENEGSLN